MSEGATPGRRAANVSATSADAPAARPTDLAACPPLSTGEDSIAVRAAPRFFNERPEGPPADVTSG
jgi:hypothetical protein